MRVLALDTTRAAASAALIDEERVIAEHADEGVRSQAEKLPAMLFDLLRDAGATLDAVDVFAVASGPGSFTGLRIGIATIQGLALVSGRPVVPVSALEALAQASSLELASGSLVGAWLDARRRDVFGALYRVQDAPAFDRERLQEVEAALVAPPALVWQRWRKRFGTPAVLAGDGAVAYADLTRADGSVRVEPGTPLASVIGRMAWRRAKAGQVVTPAGIQPLYVRRPDAEIARDARTDGSTAAR